MIYVTCHICVEVGAERQAEEGSFLCSICLVRTYLILNEIKDLYEWISDPEYLAGTREPSSHYTKSRPPVSLHTVSLLDPRTKMRRKGDPVSALRVLKAWSQAVASIESPSGEAEWVGRIRHLGWHVAFLKAQLSWISAQPAVTRFARHMACVLHSLRQEVGLTTSSDGGESDE